MKSLIPLGMLLFSGCAVMESPDSARVPPYHRERVIAFSRPINDFRPDRHEIRLFDSRIIRELRKSDPYPNAVFLNGPQKTAIIVGATIVGVYLISEWIEDEVAFFPGP